MSGTVYINGIAAGSATQIENTVTFDEIILHNDDTLVFPITITTGTATSGGTWSTSGPWAPGKSEPDMTDWPAADIIDWFAWELAEKRPRD